MIFETINTPKAAVRKSQFVFTITCPSSVKFILEDTYHRQAIVTAIFSSSFNILTVRDADRDLSSIIL